MPKNKARPLGYVHPLLKFLEEKPLPKPRGRRPILVGMVYGRLLSAIAKVHAKNRNYATDLSIARKLRERPEYKHLSERQLRRHVGDVISDLIDSFKAIPPQSWREKIGISPPPAMTKKLLREKVFEWLPRG